MDPIHSKVDLPYQSSEHFVHLVSNLLSPSECHQIIEDHEKSLISTSGAYSSRLRHMYLDYKLVDVLWDRLKPFYASARVVDEEGQAWRATSLNPFLRFCKYKPGDDFGPHQDGRRMMNVNEQSFMTVNIYLTTVPIAHGGATRVLERSEGDNKHKVIGAMQPVEGMASIFRDSLFHDGERLKEGVKYLLRTDVIYQRETPFDFEAMFGGLSAQEKAAKAINLAERLEDGGNRDGAVMWYRKAYKLNPELESGGS
jgi:hypothetical protein